MSNIWGREGCSSPYDERCIACCVAKLCPKVTPQGCPDYDNRPAECAAFHCGNRAVSTETRNRLKDIAEDDY